MDKGPWDVGVNYDRIDSDDFTHDASLILYGDFAPEDRRPYLQFIADQLNSCTAKDAEIKRLREAIEVEINGHTTVCHCHLCSAIRRRAKEG
jgi:hypothetical protein